MHALEAAKKNDRFTLLGLKCASVNEMSIVVSFDSRAICILSLYTNYRLNRIYETIFSVNKCFHVDGIAEKIVTTLRSRD